MTTPNKQERQIVLDPTLYQKKDVTINEIVQQVVEQQKPNSDNQWASGYLLIAITVIIALKMYFDHKKDSPSAKEAMALKVSLMDDITGLKNSFNDELLKRDRFEDKRYNGLTLEINTINSEVIHNAKAIHELRIESNEKFDTIIKLLSSQKT